MVLLKLQYMFELGRIASAPATVSEHLGVSIGLRVCDLAFPLVVAAAAKLGWARDPFDRLIVGHAAAARRPLITADQSILDNYPDAIW